MLNRDFMHPTRREALFLLGGAAVAAPRQSLLDEFSRIAGLTDGTVGAAMLHLGSGERVSLNGDDRFCLASVCKLPLAMNMLALVDEGKFRLDREIEVLPQDVVSSVSYIGTVWPGQRRFRLSDMLEWMVANSDNSAVETLFRVGGGEPAMAARFRQWKIDGVRVDRSERQCGLDRNGVTNYPPPAQWTDAGLNALIARVPPEQAYRATLRYMSDPRDTGTPNGTVQLLARLFRGELLSKESTGRLVEILKSTKTFSGRLPGLLPRGTVVARKTGSTRAVKHVVAATNDSGVIYLPDGALLAISVYVKASTRKDATRDIVIARMARAAFDHFKSSSITTVASGGRA
jgi:beta-lactamase class A